jgi:hypothetical protein
MGFYPMVNPAAIPIMFASVPIWKKRSVIFFEIVKF